MDDAAKELSASVRASHTGFAEPKRRKLRSFAAIPTVDEGA
jgi:hypothetical protein